MSAQIFIRIVNFKCFIDFSLTLVEGINFLVGNSGNGKTTVNKAIYYCIYGGRKFKNLQNRDHKDKPTMVSIHHQSQTFEWRITRTRPSESVIVEVRDSNGTFTYKDAPAQDWINKQFGVENIWLSASYIGVTRPHFLVGGNSNADKLELLQRITYGDSAPQNQPDTYLNEVKKAILYYNERFKQLNDNIRINEGVKQSYQTRNPLLVTHPNITDEEAWHLSNQRDNEKMELERLRGVWSELISKEQFKKHIQTLPIYNESLSDVISRIEIMKQQLKKLKLKIQLNDFDPKVYDTDMTILSSDHFLYSKYISMGFNVTDNMEDLFIFLEEKKQQLKEYNIQEEIILKNKEIVENNNKKNKMNESMTITYQKELNDYEKTLDEISIYNKRKKEIEEIKSKKIELTKINENDNMSSIFINNMIVSIKNDIEILESKIISTKKYNTFNEQIKDKESKIIHPSIITMSIANEEITSLQEKDDLSIQYIWKMFNILTSNIELCKRKIIEVQKYKTIQNFIEENRNKLPILIKIDETDDKTSDYIQRYREKQLINLSIYKKKYDEIEWRKRIENEIKTLENDLSSFVCVSLSDSEDNMSVNYAQEYKVILMMQVNELTCPCCSHGLLFNNGVLLPGTTKDNSEEAKNLRINKISLVNDEYVRRLNRDNLIKKINELTLSISKFPDDDQDNITKEINLINISLINTDGELQKRNIYWSIINDIVKYESELTNIKIYDLELLNKEISDSEELMLIYKEQLKIRESFDIIKNQITNMYLKLQNLNCYDIKSIDEEITNKKLVLENIENELQKRISNEEANKIISVFESIILPSTPNIPIEPILMSIDELIPIKYITKPSLEIFDRPIHSYHIYSRLWKSNSIKHLDIELKSITCDDYIFNGSINNAIYEIEEKIKKDSDLINIMKKVEDEKLRYETLISTLPKDDPLIEKKLNDLYNSIASLEMKISLANEMKEIRRIDATILQMTSELNTTVEYLGHFNYYYSATEELGMVTLEKRIIDVNEPLKEVLDSIFDEPISVKISPFKELKNGTTKLQVNLIVEHKNSLVDDYDDDCSTGQIGRISIALLLAFARNNSNPFIIIDEVLSSVESTRQTEILDILPQYAIGKFIINICHGIPEGNAKNVIYIN